MSRSKRKLLLLDTLFALFLVSFDQFTKHLAVRYLKGSSSYVLIRDVLELKYLENTGSAFGMLQGHRFLLLAVGVLLVAFLCVFLVRLPEGRRYNWLHLLGVGIAAGGLGNMLDRFRLGYVVDFIYFVLIDYPIFNVADIYVVLSAIGLFILILFVYKDEDITPITENWRWHSGSGSKGE